MIDLKEIKPDYPDDSIKDPAQAQDLYGKFGKSLSGKFKTTSTIPTAAPFNYFDQIQIYKNGGVKALYVWDNTNTTWWSVALS